MGSAHVGALIPNVVEIFRELAAAGEAEPDAACLVVSGTQHDEGSHRCQS